MPDVDLTGLLVAIAVAAMHELRAWLQARQARRERAEHLAQLDRTVEDGRRSHGEPPTR